MELIRCICLSREQTQITWVLAVTIPSTTTRRAHFNKNIKLTKRIFPRGNRQVAVELWMGQRDRVLIKVMLHLLSRWRVWWDMVVTVLPILASPPPPKYLLAAFNSPRYCKMVNFKWIDIKIWIPRLPNTTIQRLDTPNSLFNSSSIVIISRLSPTNLMTRRTLRWGPPAQGCTTTIRPSQEREL